MSHLTPPVPFLDGSNDNFLPKHRVNSRVGGWQSMISQTEWTSQRRKFPGRFLTNSVLVFKVGKVGFRSTETTRYIRRLEEWPTRLRHDADVPLNRRGGRVKWRKGTKNKCLQLGVLYRFTVWDKVTDEDLLDRSSTDDVLLDVVHVDGSGHRKSQSFYKKKIRDHF